MAGRIWLAMLFVVGGCGSGVPGTTASGGQGGGTSGTGGVAGSLGGSSGQDGAAGASDAADPGTGGASGSGGNAGAGVVAGSGGAAGTGGAAGAGGVGGVGGTVGTGGRAGSGGAAGTGGRGGSGGAAGTGGGGTGGGGPYPEAPGLCKDGWCWSNPLPQGNTLTSMCGRSASDVWVSGHGATLLHWDGTRWTSLPTGIVGGTRWDLYDVWCGPGGSVWAVGVGGIVRQQGGVVTNLTPAGDDVYWWQSVGGTAEDDVWIGGRYDTILHWNGSELVQVRRAPSSARDSSIFDIVARARNDVWFGTSATTFHYDGATITEQPLKPTFEGPQHFWWAPGDDLLAANYDGIYRWSEQAPASWQKVSAPFTRGKNTTIGVNMFGLSSRDLWWTDGAGDVLSHWDGTSWFSFSTPTLWNCGYVAPTGEVFAAGSALGQVAPTPARVQDRTLEITGRGWGLYDFTGIWSTPAGVVHAVPGPYRLTADGWMAVTPAGKQPYIYTAIWGSGENDVWAVGSYGAIAHFDGQSWTAVNAGIPEMDAYTLFAVGGTGPSDVWVVGRNGMIGHYDGSAWKFGLQATLNNLYGVWAISPEDVWAVGQNGTRIHYANRAWTAIQPISSQPFQAVWAAAANDVWIAADQGTVLHWNGTTWTSTAIANNGPPRLDAIAGRASNDVWVTGQSGTLLHWDGARWSDGGSPTSYNLSALWVGSAGDVWLAGKFGFILRRR